MSQAGVLFKLLIWPCRLSLIVFTLATLSFASTAVCVARPLTAVLIAAIRAVVSAPISVPRLVTSVAIAAARLVASVATAVTRAAASAADAVATCAATLPAIGSPLRSTPSIKSIRDARSVAN